MAERAFTVNTSRGRFVKVSLIDTAAAAGNKLVHDDTTPALAVTGVYVVKANATYVKGSSTSGQLLLIADGVQVATSGTASTTDGEVLAISWTGAVASSLVLKAAIVGTATGASLNYARIGAYDASIS